MRRGTYIVGAHNLGALLYGVVLMRMCPEITVSGSPWCVLVYSKSLRFHTEYTRAVPGRLSAYTRCCSVDPSLTSHEIDDTHQYGRSFFSEPCDGTTQPDTPPQYVARIVLPHIVSRCFIPHGQIIYRS